MKRALATVVVAVVWVVVRGIEALDDWALGGEEES